MHKICFKNNDMKYIITLITINLILFTTNAQSIFEKKTNDNLAYQISGEIIGLKDSSVAPAMVGL